MRVNCVLSCNFVKQGEDIEDIKHFNVKNFDVLPSSDLNSAFDNNVRFKLLSEIEEFETENSGWSLKEILNLNINFNKFVPFAAGFSTFAELPKVIRDKKAVINIKNKDQHCFLWSVVAARHPADTHVDRVKSYPHYNEVLKYDGINFPFELKDIHRFEKMNDLTIHIYGLDYYRDIVSVNVLHLSKHKSQRDAIHLLLIQGSQKVDNESIDYNHICLIKNLSRLCRSQISDHGNKLYFCDRCLNHFSEEYSYINHKNDCFEINECRMILPSKKEEMIKKFANFKFKEKVPFAVYADIECLLTKTDVKPTCTTEHYQQHVPFSIAYYLKCSYDDSLSKFKLYRKDDCIKWFVLELESLAKNVDCIIKTSKAMVLTEKEQKEFDTATICHICEKELGKSKHRDHCHLTGKYRGAAHPGCNINYKISCKIPVVFHNLSGYDSHFLIKDLAKMIEGELDLLPINKQHYISFTKNIKGLKTKLCFIDSFRFMMSSLDKLSSNLDKSRMSITRKEYPNQKQFDLVTKKGVFPYDYLDSWEKLNDDKLPSKEDFFSILYNQAISEHASLVWDIFKIKTLAQYSDLYLKTDVLLLADVVENFRETCLETYGLDPLNYCTGDLSREA